MQHIANRMNECFFYYHLASLVQTHLSWLLNNSLSLRKSLAKGKKSPIFALLSASSASSKGFCLPLLTVQIWACGELRTYVRSVGEAPPDSRTCSQHLTKYRYKCKLPHEIRANLRKEEEEETENERTKSAR